MTIKGLDFEGLHLSQRVKQEGYVSMGSSLWAADKNAPYHCERSVTISLME